MTSLSFPVMIPVTAMMLVTVSVAIMSLFVSVAIISLSIFPVAMVPVANPHVAMAPVTDCLSLCCPSPDGDRCCVSPVCPPCQGH